MTNFIPPVTGSLGAPINKENFLLKLGGAARLGAVHHHREKPREEQEGSTKCRGGDAPQVGKTQPEFTKSLLTITNKKPTYIGFD